MYSNFGAHPIQISKFYASNPPSVFIVSVRARSGTQNILEMVFGRSCYTCPRFIAVERHAAPQATNDPVLIINVAGLDPPGELYRPCPWPSLPTPPPPPVSLYN
jgi:hypothetical protein